VKKGMNDQGLEISGLSYLRQRIADVFRIEKGSIPTARKYGSTLHELTDLNVDDNFNMSVYERVLDAFEEPENDLNDCKLSTVSISSKDNKTMIDVRCVFYGENIELKGLSYE